jgi:mRNA interferase MazF
MGCSRNEIVLLPIPFSDLTSRKVRPAIVLGRVGADLFLVPVSSVIANTDFPLAEWRNAGLNVPCGVKAQWAPVEEKLQLHEDTARRSVRSRLDAEALA